MSIKKGELTRKFGLKLKIERTKLGLSQEKLAGLSNISTSSYSAIENGKSTPSLETVGAIANALGIDISELVNVNKVEL